MTQSISFGIVALAAAHPVEHALDLVAERFVAAAQVFDDRDIGVGLRDSGRARAQLRAILSPSSSPATMYHGTYGAFLA